MNKNFPLGRRLLATLAVSALLNPGSILAEESEGIGETGTDPRDFAPKFMPYYRYTELENGLEQQEAVLFGLYAFDSKFAMTYEIPVAMERDVSDTPLKGIDPSGQNECGPGNLDPGVPGLPGGLPVGDGDCDETGVGDMNLRFMYRTDWDALGGDWIIGAQFDFPTASEDVLGSETFAAAPMFAYVKDLDFWPAPGAFFAAMNFYFTDVWKDDSREDVSSYVGRWFLMLPLHPSGIYMLPEFQPIYDFEEEEFSFWVGPEIGKLLAPGRIIYMKPGWGADPGDPDRKFTFEVGFRYFMD